MIRRVTLADAVSIAKIYNRYIMHSEISFETKPLSVEAMRQRIAAIAAEYPYFVYEDEEGIAGYCYAHACRLLSYMGDDRIFGTRTRRAGYRLATHVATHRGVPCRRVPCFGSLYYGR